VNYISGVVHISEILTYFDKDRWMDFKDTLEYLPIKERKLRKYISQGNIPYFKVGGQLAFKKSELDRWMEQWRAHREQDSDIERVVDECLAEVSK